MLDYDKATGMVSFRHYLIQTVPRGVSRSIKRIVQRQNLPNLADYDDISEYVKRYTFLLPLCNCAMYTS